MKNIKKYLIAFICLAIIPLPFKVLDLDYLFSIGTDIAAIAMVPPDNSKGKGEGGAASTAAKQVVNKYNRPGCSTVNSSEERPDGSIIKRETLVCTKETKESPDGKSKQKPAITSLNSSKVVSRFMQNDKK